MILFRRKAKKRLDTWRAIRKEDKRQADIKRIKEEKLAAEKKAIRDKLMAKYDLEDFYGRVFWYHSDDDIYPTLNENNHRIDYKRGDILPFKRRGDLVFFYEITDINSKYGDYGYSDYAYFHDMTYNHFEKIPEKIVDPKKSLKIEWTKDEKFVTGRVQGIRVVNLTLGEYVKYKYSGRRRDVEAKYIKQNINQDRSHNSLPRYYERYTSLTEAKKEVQQIINKIMRKENGTIHQFYIAPKLRKRK